jgi:hypothetical protein
MMDSLLPVLKDLELSFLALLTLAVMGLGLSWLWNLCLHWYLAHTARKAAKATARATHARLAYLAAHKDNFI